MCVSLRECVIEGVCVRLCVCMLSTAFKGLLTLDPGPWTLASLPCPHPTPQVCHARRNMDRVMPFAYVVHMRTFLALYLACVPLIFTVYLQVGGKMGKTACVPQNPKALRP